MIECDSDKSCAIYCYPQIHRSLAVIKPALYTGIGHTPSVQILTTILKSHSRPIWRYTTCAIKSPTLNAQRHNYRKIRLRYVAGEIFLPVCDIRYAKTA